VPNKSYKSFPRADARRYFVALLSADRLQDRATIHYISQEIGSTRAEAQRALDAAALQFGVVFERDGSVYRIVSWGGRKKNELTKLVKSDE
jgi:hypothetical protein